MTSDEQLKWLKKLLGVFSKLKGEDVDDAEELLADLSGDAHEYSVALEFAIAQAQIAPIAFGSIYPLTLRCDRCNWTVVVRSPEEHGRAHCQCRPR